MKLIDKLIKSAVIEEMNVGDRKYLDKGVEQILDNERSPISEIFPPNFESMIASKQYNDLVKQLEQITGKQSPDWMAVMFQVVSAMSSIAAIEGPKKKELEKLAVDTVLSLREWKRIKDDNIKKGQLRIEATIIKPDFTKQMAEFEKSIEEDEPEAAAAETEVVDLVVDLIEDDNKLKKDLAKFITQGEAATGFNVYQLIKDKIDSINPNLYNLYKLFVVGGLLNYFAGPLNMMEAANAIGSVEVIADENDENVYVIKAIGVNFVLLIHEIIKGLYSFLHVDIGRDEGTDSSEERRQLILGQKEAAIFRARLLAVADSSDDLEYWPMVFRLLLGSDPETQVYGQDLKDIVNNKPSGMQILKDCLDKAKQLYLNSDNTEEDTGADTDEDTNNDNWKNG